jgi:5-methylcytosine-specific restriction endonuclease McrA
MSKFLDLSTEYQILAIAIIVVVIAFLKRWVFERSRKRRREYYQNGYLKSDDWRRKRYVVLRRDNWRCVYCGARATQVHHKKYAKYNIGREPIDWLVSVCNSCHDKMHN